MLNKAKSEVTLKPQTVEILQIDVFLFYLLGGRPWDQVSAGICIREFKLKLKIVSVEGMLMLSFLPFPLLLKWDKMGHRM